MMGLPEMQPLRAVQQLRATIPVGAALLILTACDAPAPAPPPPPAPLVVFDTVGVPAFDGEAAHALLRRQVEFGPRVPGMAGHAAQLDWMTSYLSERADTVLLQEFTHTASNGATLRMTNVFARFRPDLADRILLVAHWDTRPTADQSADRADQPIPGANDGASGTAVLLQLADVLSRHGPPVGVDLLFVDGEDYGPGSQDMYLGAKHFAATTGTTYRPLYGVLADMVGDQTPRFPMEGHSLMYAPEVVDRVWRAAAQLGLDHIFVRQQGPAISDDHVPLNEAGIRTIDIIDFDYGPANRYWHTHDDVVANTSAVGLEAVGRVLALLVFNGG